MSDRVNNKIMKLLAKGRNQTQIAEEMTRTRFEIISLSSVEKRIKKLKAEHKAKTLFHLATILKDKDLI